MIALPLGLHDFINEKIRNQIAANVKIEPGSQVYDQWKKPTIPIYLRIYTFSIVNPLEVKAGKPAFVFQRGPYSYRESRQKINITWGHSNVNYDQITQYTFDPNTSCHGCDPKKDEITSVNIPMVAILQKIKPYSNIPGFDTVVSLLLEYLKEGLFHTKIVHDTIWGYEEPLFEQYNEFRKEAVRVPFIGKYLDKVLPKIPPRFALEPNPSYDGNTTVNTGQSDINNVGCYERWRDNIGKLRYWHSRTANMLNGTDGSIYKPDISNDDVLYIFITQLCRSLNVKYLDEVTIEGIDGYRFNAPKYLFESGDINPDNKGFCDPNCLPSGLLSISVCVPFNAPIVVSQPHFLNANKTLLQKVLGLNPQEDKHDTFVSIEPNTGIILQASKRIQFNIYIEPLKGIEELGSIVAAYVPLMWINEHVRIDSTNAQKVKKDVLDILEIVKWVERGLFILGGLMVLIAVILFIRLCCRRKDDTNMKLLAENGRDYGSVSNGQGQLNPSLINASD